jgi:maltodextrin utilization protein YvdJ
MGIKLDDTEFDCYDFEESNKGQQFSFRVDAQTDEERESLKKLLTKKHLILTKENGETTKVTVRNSSENYSLRDGQTQPSEYHLSIELEKFDREAEINKLLEEVEHEYGVTWLNANAVSVIRDLLIDKGIITNEEYNSKMDIADEKLKKNLKKGVEELIDKKFET